MHGSILGGMTLTASVTVCLSSRRVTARVGISMRNAVDGKGRSCVVVRKSPWARRQLRDVTRVLVECDWNKKDSCLVDQPASLEHAGVDTAKLELVFRPSARGGDAR